MIASLLRQLADKLKALTARERAGLAILSAVLAIAGAIAAADWAGRSAETAAAVTQSAANAESLRLAFSDEAYVEQIAENAGKIWRWSRISDTLTEEEVLADVESLAAQAGLNNAQVALVEGASEGPVATLDFALSADFEWSGFLALLEAIENSETSFLIRSIEVTDGQDAQQLAITLAAPVIEESAFE